MDSSNAGSQPQRTQPCYINPAYIGDNGTSNSEVMLTDFSQPEPMTSTGTMPSPNTPRKVIPAKCRKYHPCAIPEGEAETDETLENRVILSVPESQTGNSDSENDDTSGDDTPNCNFVYPRAQTRQHVTRAWLLAAAIALQAKLENEHQEAETSDKCWLPKNRQLASINSAMKILQTKILPKLAASNDQYLTLDELKCLSVAFEKMARLLPSAGPNSELCQLIAAQLRSEWSRLTKYQLYEPKVKELDYLTVPGNSKQVEKSGGIAAGTSIVPLLGISRPEGPYVEGEIGLGTKARKRVNDEGKVYKEKFCALSIGANGGCNWNALAFAEAGINGSAKAERTTIKWKKWKNLRHHVYSKGQKLCWDNRHDNSESTGMTKLKHKIQKKLSMGNELARHKKHQECAANGQQRLNELVTRHLGLNGSGLKVPKNTRVKPAKGKTTSYTSQFDVSGGIQASLGEPIGAKVGIKATATAKWDRIRKHEFEPKPLWEHPETIAKEHIPDMSAALPDNPTADDICTTLAALDTAFTDYTCLLQQYDYSKGKPWLRSDMERLQAAKHSIENDSGIIGRHQAIQRASLTLAAIAQAAEANGLMALAPTAGGKTVKERIFKVGEKITDPDFIYSKFKLDKVTTAHRCLLKKYCDKTVTLTIDIPVFTGQVELFTRWRNHPNRFRAGNYRDITVIGSFNPSIQREMAGADLADAIKKIAAELGHEIEAEFNIFPDFGITAEKGYRVRYFKPQYTQEADYQGNSGWQRLWSRCITETGYKFDLNTRVTVQPGVHVGPHITYKNLSTSVSKETLGTDCFIYTAMMFNRYYSDSGNTANNHMWNRFKGEHDKELKQIFINVAQGSPTLSQTLSDWQSELQFYEASHPNHLVVTGVNQAFTDFQQAIQAFGSYQNDTNYQAAMKCLEDILAMLAVPLKEEYDNMWSMKNYKHKSAQKTSTQMLVKLGIHPRMHSYNL